MPYCASRAIRMACHNSTQCIQARLFVAAGEQLNISASAGSQIQNTGVTVVASFCCRKVPPSLVQTCKLVISTSIGRSLHAI